MSQNLYGNNLRYSSEWISKLCRNCWQHATDPVKQLQETGCEILAKAEFLNPGGSVKDRAALYIIQEAEEKVCSNRVARW